MARKSLGLQKVEQRGKLKEVFGQFQDQIPELLQEILTPKERTILIASLALDHRTAPMSYSELADVFKISPSYVAQICQKAYFKVMRRGRMIVYRHKHFASFTNGQTEPKITLPLLMMPVHLLELKHQTSRVLRNNFVYLGELLLTTEIDLLALHRFGPKSLREVKDCLEQLLEQIYLAPGILQLLDLNTEDNIILLDRFYGQMKRAGHTSQAVERFWEEQKNRLC